jgi:hypothetical protein
VGDAAAVGVSVGQGEYLAEQVLRDPGLQHRDSRVAEIDAGAPQFGEYRR